MYLAPSVSTLWSALFIGMVVDDQLWYDMVVVVVAGGDWVFCPGFWFMASSGFLFPPFAISPAATSAASTATSSATTTSTSSSSMVITC